MMQQSRGQSGTFMEPAERSLVKLKELAELLKSTRDERNLTLAEAAKEIGLSASTLSRIENAKYIPRTENLAQICEWLGISPDRFLDIAANPISADTMSEIAVHLRADRKLSAPAAEELITVIRTLYNRYAKEVDLGTER